MFNNILISIGFTYGTMRLLLVNGLVLQSLPKDSLTIISKIDFLHIHHRSFLLSLLIKSVVHGLGTSFSHTLGTLLGLL